MKNDNYNLMYGIMVFTYIVSGLCFIFWGFQGEAVRKMFTMVVITLNTVICASVSER